MVSPGFFPRVDFATFSGRGIYRWYLAVVPCLVFDLDEGQDGGAVLFCSTFRMFCNNVHVAHEPIHICIGSID